MFRQIAKENRMRLSAFISRAGWLTVTLLSIAVAFSAQAQPAPAAAPGEIAPYVEDTTIAIARLDLDRLNSDAAVDWEAKFLQALESDPSDTGKALRELAKPHIKQWTSEFVRAGGKTVYIVAKMNDATPAFAIVPLGLGASPKVLSEMLKDPFSGSLLAGTPTTTQPASEPPLAYLKSEVIGTALYFYPAQAFGDLHHFTEAARPELEKAFAEAGDAPVRVAFSPPEGLRQLLAHAKELPEELGGGPVTPVSSGLRWASLALQTRSDHEGFSLSLIIQAKDAATAQQLSGILDTAHQTVAKEKGRENAEVNEFLSVVAPKITSEHPDQLRLTLDEAQTQNVLNMFADSIRTAHRLALQTQSMGNERQICTAIIFYANDHDGVLPRDLRVDLKKYLGDDPGVIQKVFTNPRQPARKEGYVYIRPANNVTGLKNASETPILYEAFDEWGEGINVGFADGHVELIRDSSEFNKILKNNPNVARGAELP
jgi:prepilin-type processing-associated H-X9-DG protein